MKLSTRAVHAGRDDLVDLGLHAVPIDLSTTYPSRDSHGETARLDLAAAGEALSGSQVYGRVGNPTVARFEAALAELEGCAAAVAFASGMAALSACLLAAVTAGRPHVVGVRPLYGTTDHVLETGLLGTTVTWATADKVESALRNDTGLVIVESPANPTLEEHDLGAIAAACGDVPLLVDNTFATPIRQRPVESGARIVMHSATKFLGGHGDVLAGVIACDEPYARVLRQIRFATGAVLHPLAGYLLLRGLSTLPIRVRAASATAATLAARLATHPAVAKVHYPGGPLVSVEIHGDPHQVISAVRLLTPAVSLGSVDSLIQIPAALTHRVMGADSRADSGISDRLIRISIGLEDVEDLWQDLNQALSVSHRVGDS
ncbi:trans-sulfuration enzyme family protein [Actinocrispum wychmicini]|uniref:homocysteine desulfhydrase n=1 Tax=Actinocrispum wychmicini TaxID=1213861 RepID=A0A4V2S7M3_9PSEU|nr:aminotransferase class I/II-fold pyridoxal phosphate-dependent enzyme [Actinocrispum wychmicini]TCO60480.1 methionine-gamma-lyase [Actinocrispum wychmicini]